MYLDHFALPSFSFLLPTYASWGSGSHVGPKGNSRMEAGTQMEPGALLTTGPLCQPSIASLWTSARERKATSLAQSVVTWGVLLRAARPSVRASSLQSKTVPNMRGAAYAQDPFSECQLCSGGSAYVSLPHSSSFSYSSSFQHPPTLLELYPRHFP